MIDQEIRRGQHKFERGTIIPQVLPGTEVYKFHGQPVLIPIREEGESLYQQTGYTRRQLRAMQLLELSRTVPLETTGYYDYLIRVSPETGTQRLEDPGFAYAGLKEQVGTCPLIDRVAMQAAATAEYLPVVQKEV